MPPQADNEQGGTTMRTHESQEMYLETILLLRMRKSNVRSVDIVEELGYAKSSVSRAVNLLQDAGFIRIDAMGDITLTPAGQKKAEDVYEKHRVITHASVRMGAPQELAEENACRVEHVVSDEMFEIIKAYFEER